MPRSSFLQILTAVALFSSTFLMAQGGRPSSGGGRATTPTTTPGISPGIGQRDLSSDRRLVFISGKVRFADGTPITEPITVERVCSTTVHREGYTDLEGDFQFQLGSRTADTLPDASESTRSSIFTSNDSIGPSSGTVTRRDLYDCELRAVFPGYQSTSVRLNYFGDPGPLQVGTIVLKRLSDSPGTTISMTTMQAPKDARNAYEKAQKDLANKKLTDAEKQLTHAVDIFPRFAAAWWLLGTIHEQQNNLEKASTDYSQALAADPVFVSPYYRLGLIAMHQEKWQEAAQFTDKVATLSPLAFPDAYFYNAAANYQLGKFDAAEKTARKFESVDNQHRHPEVSLLLGDLLELKGDYAAAAEQKKNYLKAVPDSPVAETVKAKVKQLEEMSGVAPH